MGEWRKTTLGEVLGPKGYIRGPFGSSLKRGELLSHGIPVYEQQHAIYGTRDFRFFIGKDKYKELSRFTVQPNDIIISCSGTLGRISVIRDGDPVGIISQALLLLRPDTTRIDPTFLFYILSSPAGFHSMVSVSTGSVQVNIARRSIIEAIEIDLPPLVEQRAIATVLGTLDDKIRLNSRANETLEAMAQMIFKDWFVDFGPTRAKMDNRAAYLASDIWALFPQRLDDDGKPEEWEPMPARGMIDFNPSERLARGQTAPYLDMGALPTLGSWPEDPVMRDFASGSKFRNGDALLARITPCLENGKAAFVQNLDDGAVGWGSTEFIVMRARPPMPPAYAYIVARNIAFKDRAVQSMTGTSGRQRVQVDSLGEFVLLRPSLNVAEAFGELISPWFAKVAANARESQTLTATRVALLPKLMSGEIRVRDAEKAVEAVR